MTPDVDPQTGLTVQVVEPGSAEDPFTKGGGGTSTPVAQVVDPSASAQVSAPTAAEATPASTTTLPEAKSVAGETIPAATTTGEVDEVAEQEAMTRLNAWLDEQLEAKITPALRAQQGNYDRTISKLQSTLEARQAEEQVLRDRVRELQLNGLSDEEKSKLQGVWEQEDRTAKLDAWETELDLYYREQLIVSYQTEFTQYGIIRESLAECETAEEMEILCLEAKATHLEGVMNGTRPAVTAAAAARPPVLELKPAPAGASARSDVGGGAVPEPKPQPRTGQTPDDFATNLQNLEVATIRVR